MIKKIYSIYDRKAGTYSKIFDCPNDEFAHREFSKLYNMPEVSYLAPDMELYRLGEINYETGVIIPEVKPYFIGGVVNG